MAVVAVAGASGFVGRALISQLLKAGHQVIGLSRSAKPSTDQLEWRQCDVFSLLQVEKALAGVDVGIYLVHSMLPSARLTQASFEDIDLIAADNFARAASQNSLQQIIYLGGLIPEKQSLSRHLKSRLEVEDTLRSYDIPVTTFRAGLVVGSGGSSFEMLNRLVDRLPVMILPAWTKTHTQTSDIRDVTSILEKSILKPECMDETFDLGSYEVLTYAEMIRATARIKNKSTLFFNLNLFTPGLSKLWVSLVTNTPYVLVSPLVESLRYPMVCRDHRIYSLIGLQPKSFQESLQQTLEDEKKLNVSTIARTQLKLIKEDSQVRSVQRLPLPPGKRAKDVAHEYLRWLPQAFFNIIQVELHGSGQCTFYWNFLLRIPLLVLELDGSRSQLDRQLFRIKGGVLARTHCNGRLEFRETADKKSILAAIHNYAPRLPWFIYNRSQAKLHLWVMKRFGRHLKNLA